MNKISFYKKLTSGIFYFSILLFIIAFNFSDNGSGGWQLQNLPFLNDRPLRDMTFTDSLTGYGITKGGNNGDSDYVIKTYNGGDNWSILNTFYAELNHIKFINSSTGFISGGDRLGHGLFLKTTNGGVNWNQINTPEVLQIIDMSVISEDSLWITGNFFTYSLYSSINGGASWDLKFTTGNGIDKIYFDKNFGFFGNNFELWKTTNYGNNWLLIPGQNGFNDMIFVDSSTGWKCKDSTRKTVDGGITWERQYIPRGGILSGNLTKFSMLNKDTLWGTGGSIEYSTTRYRGFLYYTSNGGNNWLYQIPDTSYGIPGFKFINFINANIGWANESYFSQKTIGLVNRGIHTISGGDSSFLTILRNENQTFVKTFILSQNYPNPFNPSTKISYELKQRGKVLLKVFNSLGKEIETLVEQTQTSGNYKVDFPATGGGSGLSSGVFFYSLFVDGVRIDTKKMMLIR